MDLWIYGSSDLPSDIGGLWILRSPITQFGASMSTIQLSTSTSCWDMLGNRTGCFEISPYRLVMGCVAMFCSIQTCWFWAVPTSDSEMVSVDVHQRHYFHWSNKHLWLAKTFIYPLVDCISSHIHQQENQRGHTCGQLTMCHTALLRAPGGALSGL